MHTPASCTCCEFAAEFVDRARAPVDAIDGKGTLASTGAAPSTAVLVDVLGIILTVLICEAVLGRA